MNITMELRVNHIYFEQSDKKEETDKERDTEREYALALQFQRPKLFTRIHKRGKTFRKSKQSVFETCQIDS